MPQAFFLSGESVVPVKKGAGESYLKSFFSFFTRWDEGVIKK